MRKSLTVTRPLPSLMTVLALVGCGPYFQIPRTGADTPTPVVQGVEGGTEDPNVFTNPAAFQVALLNALSARDASKLVNWMTNPVLIGTWRGDQSETSPADAIKGLLGEELAADPHLGRLNFAEVRARMGDKDPFSMPRADAGVVNAFLIAGWGRDDRQHLSLY